MIHVFSFQYKTEKPPHDEFTPAAYYVQRLPRKGPEPPPRWTGALSPALTPAWRPLPGARRERKLPEAAGSGGCTGGGARGRGPRQPAAFASRRVSASPRHRKGYRALHPLSEGRGERRSPGPARSCGAPGAAPRTGARRGRAPDHPPHPRPRARRLLPSTFATLGIRCLPAAVDAILPPFRASPAPSPLTSRSAGARRCRGNGGAS